MSDLPNPITSKSGGFEKKAQENLEIRTSNLETYTCIKYIVWCMRQIKTTTTYYHLRSTVKRERFFAYSLLAHNHNPLRFGG